MRDAALPPVAMCPVVGYLLVRAQSLDGAKELIVGNPTFVAGDTVEIRELPTDE